MIVLKLHSTVSFCQQYFSGCTCLLFLCLVFCTTNTTAGDKPFVDDIESSLSASLKALDVQQAPVVDNIVISGNNKTKTPIILREAPFTIGDTLALDNLSDVLQRTKNNIKNTSLFKDVSLNVKKSGKNAITVHIDVNERWYIYPIPIFQLADRNFNVWWRDYNHDFSRTVYGLKYIQNNLTGRGDRLKVVAARGYKEKYWLEYKRPYIDRQKRFGLELDAKFEQTKELAYDSEENELERHKSNDFLQRYYEGTAIVSYRNKMHQTHNLSVGYRQVSIKDTIKELNPSYFGNDKSAQKYFTIGYNYELDTRDRQSYPLQGVYFNAHAIKRGLFAFQNLNSFQLDTRYSHHFDLGNKFYFSHDLGTKLSLSKQKLYYRQPGLGYENFFVRGYEYYVMDGQFIALGKFELKHKLFSFKINNTDLININHFNNPPLKFFLKSYVDAGYVKDNFFYKNNPLNNHFLTGAGVGVDMVTYYDLSVRFEYSVNLLKEHGFFVHLQQKF